MENIKKILFDLDGTILDFKAGERSSFIKTINEFSSYKLKEEDITLFSDINERLFNMFASGQIKERITFQHMRFEEIFKELGISANVELANKFYLEKLKYASDMYTDVIDVLDYLSKKYDMYIASNGQGIVQEKRIKTAGIDKYFKKYYISEDCGANKPDVKFFEYIFNDLNDYCKDSFVIIGDRCETDILGGKYAGIKTIYLNRKNKNQENNPDVEIKSLYELKEIL